LNSVSQEDFILASSTFEIIALSCEHRNQPLGIDVTEPRLSWQMRTERRGARQSAYRIQAASTPELLTSGVADLWDTDKVESDQSVLVAYAGKELTSRQRVYWKVTVWNETGRSAESRPAWFELGLLQRNEWQSEWIGAKLVGGPRSMLPAPYLRKGFQLSAPIKSARLYVTALGLYECVINGQTIGDSVFAPGWTDYHKRVQYQVYDVTDSLVMGENVLGAVLGDGWAVGHIGWQHRQRYFDRPRLLAQLELEFPDGRKQTVVTDHTWKYQFGPLLHNDLLMGEEYDARLELTGWDAPGYDDNLWAHVQVFEDPGMALSATNGPGVRRIQELTPIADPVDRSDFEKRRFILDLGQNMVGRVRFKGSAPAGTTVSLRFAEVLSDLGDLYTANLRTAQATDYYTFKGEGEEVWEPKFTFHGFRYVEVMGYPGEVTRETITGVVLHSDMTPTGHFECSDALINQLQQNIVWGQKGNFVDIPTDCPQRDERLGWTGDIQVFARTAAFNFDIAGFMTRWMQDVADAQSEAGAIPPVVPRVDGVFMDDGGPAWADAVIICPWTIYLSYGDKRILRQYYGAMSRFMQFLLDTSPGYIRTAPDYEGWPGFGDWLSINANTPRDLIGTAFLAYDAGLMARIAAVLGEEDEQIRYQQLFEDVKQAFAARYLIGSPVEGSDQPSSTVRQRMDHADSISNGNLKWLDYGSVESQVFNTELFTPTQTAYVLALMFDLLPEDLREPAAAELVADFERRGMHLSTGFVGSPYLPHVLSLNGRLDAAYALLNQKSWPSWLYPVTQGATTIWERWDGWTEENGFQDAGMNSFNHYAYGSIGAWLYNTVAGIEIDAQKPGYKHIRLQPQPGGGLTSACGKLNTPYGEVISDWRLNGGAFDWNVVVPPNTTATLIPPKRSGTRITLDGVDISDPVIEVGAGKYQLTVD
jgi:alpha-L-rhamnosidase